MNDNHLTGLFADMSNAQYHDHIHIGSSGFKLLRRSPLHFWTASPLNPDRKRKEPSIYMLMGTAWHTGIWEPHLFEQTYAPKPALHAASTVYKLFIEAMADLQAFRAKYVGVPDGLTRTSKEGKAVYAEIEAKGQVGIEQSKFDEAHAMATGLQGKVLLDAESLDDVRAMSHAAHVHPTTQVIFKLPGGLSEASIFWVDSATGAPCRIRPDYHVPPCPMFPNGLIIDGKSTDDASPEEFGRTAWNSEMFFQAAFYSDGFQAHYRTKAPPQFAWLVQERDAPYATRYWSAAPNFVEYGRRKYRPLLALYAECLRTGMWPGYPPGVTMLELPTYAAKVVDETVAA